MIGGADKIFSACVSIYTHRNHPLWFHKPNPTFNRGRESCSPSSSLMKSSTPLLLFEISSPSPTYMSSPQQRYAIPFFEKISRSEISRWKKYSFQWCGYKWIKERDMKQSYKRKKARYPMSKFLMVHVRNLSPVRRINGENYARRCHWSRVMLQHGFLYIPMLSS